MNASSYSSSFHLPLLSRRQLGAGRCALAARLRALEALRPIVEAQAEALFEAHRRLLHRLIASAQDASCIGWLPFRSGLCLARELLVKDLRPSEGFRSAHAVADYLKLHFAGPPKSLAVLSLSP